MKKLNSIYLSIYLSISPQCVIFIEHYAGYPSIYQLLYTYRGQISRYRREEEAGARGDLQEVP